jgi:transcriptional regulator with XRE-family HTH domain
MPLVDITEEKHAAHEPKKRRTRRGAPRTIDQFVGARLRDRRLMLGLTQRDLANRAGASQQRIYKYELGKASVTAALLYEIAAVLDTSVDYFFDGFEADDAVQVIPPMLFTLMRNICEIKREEHLEAISQLVRSLAG